MVKQYFRGIVEVTFYFCKTSSSAFCPVSRQNSKILQISNFWSLFNVISSLVSEQLISVVFFFLLVVFIHLLHLAEIYVSLWFQSEGRIYLR